MRKAGPVFTSLANAVLVLAGVALLVFFLFNILPGDPTRLQAGRHTNDRQLALMREELGLDQPLPRQFLIFMNDLSPVSVHALEAGHFLSPGRKNYASLFTVPVGDWEFRLKLPYLRKSFYSGQKVSDILKEALPETLVLAVSAILIALVGGISLGILAAVKRGSAIDLSISFLAATGMAVPSFLAAILVAWVFGYLLHDITGLPMTGSLYTYNHYAGMEMLTLSNLILPAFALSLGPMFVFAQLMRNSLMDVLQEQYIITARAKGLRERQVVFKHALRNALNPVATSAATWFATLMAGAIFVEYVFGWKGLGHVVISSINNYDLPVIMGTTLFVTFVFVAVNFLMDVVYPLIDPAVRIK